MTIFGTLTKEGKLINQVEVDQNIFNNCPFYIFDYTHYREDGSCKCNDPEYRKTVMKKWGYKKSDFIKAGIIKKGE